MDMQKTYNPKDFEDRIYADWEQSGYFRAEVDEKKVPFTIMMPPPNITGQLHMYKYPKLLLNFLNGI